MPWIHSTIGTWYRIFKNGANGYSTELGQPYVSYAAATQPIVFSSKSECQAALPSIKQKIQNKGVLTIGCGYVADYECEANMNLKQICWDSSDDKACTSYMGGLVVEFVITWCRNNTTCP